MVKEVGQDGGLKKKEKKKLNGCHHKIKSIALVVIFLDAFGIMLQLQQSASAYNIEAVAS